MLACCKNVLMAIKYSTVPVMQCTAGQAASIKDLCTLDNYAVLCVYMWGSFLFTGGVCHFFVYETPEKSGFVVNMTSLKDALS